MLPSPAMRTASSAAGGPAPIKTASAGARKSGQGIEGLQPQQQQQETRSARKTSGPRVYRDEEHAVISIVEKSEDENTFSLRSLNSSINMHINRDMAVKSSSAMSPVIPQSATAARPPPSTATTTTSADESSSLPPLVQSRRGGKDNMQIYNIPPGVNKPGLGGKGKGKGFPAGPIGGRGKDLSSSRKRQAPSTSSISDSIEEEEQRRRLQARRREETEETTTEDQFSSLNVRSRSPRGVSWPAYASSVSI